MVDLVQDEMIEMVAQVDVRRIRRAPLKRPAARDERRIVEGLVDLLPELDQLTRRDIGDDIRSLLGKVEARRVAGNIKGRSPDIKADRAGPCRRNDAGVMTLGA